MELPDLPNYSAECLQAGNISDWDWRQMQGIIAHDEFA
jgi:hypothetical protein